MRIAGIVLPIVLFIALPPAVGARTWYVNVDGSGDAPTIQAAMDAAKPGDDVLVGPGTYDVWNQGRWRASTLVRMKSGVRLHSEEGPDVTILDAGSLDMGVRCTEVDETCTIEGFTITGASPFYLGWGRAGGGIYCYESSPNIVGNRVVRNAGGIVCYLHSSPNITDNVISDNNSENGAGIFCYYVSSPTISNNVIAGNSADLGGGVYCQGGCGPIIINNTFSGNRADFGSAVHVGSAEVISNNIFVGNRGGAALHCSINCYTDISCNAFWNNSGDGDGCSLVGSNVFADPLFCDGVGSGYGLCSFSLCAPGSPVGCGRIGAKGVECDCGTATEVDCSVSPSSLDFGRHRLGSGRDLSFTITNESDVILTGTIDESSEHYSIISGGGTYFLVPADSLTVKVRFGPLTVGPHECMVETNSMVCSGVSCTGIGEEAGPGNEGGKWVLHFAGEHDPESNTCDLQIESGSEVVVGGPSGPRSFDVYVIAAEVDKIAGTRYGLTCDGDFRFDGWTACGDLEIPTDGWPGSGEAVAQTWGEEQSGPYVTMGILDVYVYGSGLLSVAPDPRIGAAEWCDGSQPVPVCFQTTDPDAFGSVGFDRSGYNPSTRVSTERTTWGRVKAIYK